MIGLHRIAVLCFAWLLFDSRGFKEGLTMARAKYQVLVLPYKKLDDKALYRIFKRSGMDAWQFIVGGGEDEDGAAFLRRPWKHIFTKRISRHAPNQREKKESRTCRLPSAISQRVPFGSFRGQRHENGPAGKCGAHTPCASASLLGGPGRRKASGQKNARSHANQYESKGEPAGCGA